MNLQWLCTYQIVFPFGGEALSMSGVRVVGSPCEFCPEFRWFFSALIDLGTLVGTVLNSKLGALHGNKAKRDSCLTLVGLVDVEDMVKGNGDCLYRLWNEWSCSWWLIARETAVVTSVLHSFGLVLFKKMCIWVFVHGISPMLPRSEHDIFCNLMWEL